jgi:hypothetical protein
MTRFLIVTGIALGLMSTVIHPGKGPAVPKGGEPTTDARCPAVYAPVICDGGKIYPNPCYAEQHHAKNCVPLGV